MKTYVLGFLLTMSVFLNAVTFSVMYDYEDENNASKGQVAKLQKSLDESESNASYWKEKCSGYQSANEALIKHSTPQSLDKAIKATPLPKLIKGDKNV